MFQSSVSDALKSTVLSASNQQLRLQNGDHANGPAPAPKFVPDYTAVCAEYGLVPSNAQLCALGKHVAAQYVRAFGTKTPYKTERFCNGVIRQVNTYSYDKLDWYKQTILNFMKEKKWI